MDGDLDAVDEEEPQAHEELRERVVRICNIEQKKESINNISIETAIKCGVSHFL